MAPFKFIFNFALLYVLFLFLADEYKDKCLEMKSKSVKITVQKHKKTTLMDRVKAIRRCNISKTK